MSRAYDLRLLYRFHEISSITNYGDNVFRKKAITVDAVKNYLSSLHDPDFACTFVHSAIWQHGQLVGDKLTIDLAYPYLDQAFVETREQLIKQHIHQQWPSLKLDLNFSVKITRHKAQQGLKPKVGVKNIIAVASGKGGVGKSTVAVNLAQALSHLGAKVALLDADIYGPSLPRMLGQTTTKAQVSEKRFQPVWAHGMQSMSMGYLVEEQTPMVWRGPMASGALQQLLNDTLWQPCDYLILDLPPGTGDIQLTMAQKIPIAGAVIVTTPQDIALADVVKAHRMFEKLQVPVLGVVENMSYHTCTNCGHRSTPFGAGGGAKMAEDNQLRLLAQIPLDSVIQQKADIGQAIDQTAEGKAFANCAKTVAQQLALLPEERQAPVEKIVTNA